MPWDIPGRPGTSREVQGQMGLGPEGPHQAMGHPGTSRDIPGQMGLNKPGT